MSRSHGSGLTSRKIGKFLLLASGACLLASGASADTPKTSKASAAEEAEIAGQVLGEKASKTLRKRVVVKKADEEDSVPNETMDVFDADTLAAIEERWQRLRSTINRSHAFNPDPSEVSARDVRPWAPPTDTRPFGRGGDAFEVRVNGEVSSAAPPGVSASVNEPSVAAVGDYVFYTANWFAATSSDGGQTWSYVNPYAGPFAEPDDQSFCCDQQVHHDPATNTLFWLQQMIPSGGGSAGTQRINVDQGSDGTWECFYDVTAQDAGFADFTFPDYPDLALSDDHLFVTSNVLPVGAGGFVGAFVARLPLAEITACDDAMVDFHSETDFGSFRSTQGAGDTMYFGTVETLASIRVWTWPASDFSPTAVTRVVHPFLSGVRNCADPVGDNWCGFHDARFMGAAVSGKRVAFLWVAEENPIGGFPFPYVQGAILDAADNLAVIDQPLIWSNDAAWIYPSLAANQAGGFGGSHYPRCSAFLVDDENADSWAPLEHQVVASGAAGAGGNRSGDYLSTRAYSSNERVYAGSCFAYPTSGAAQSRYVLFGRAGDFASDAIFSDDFESGNAAGWHVTSP